MNAEHKGTCYRGLKTIIIKLHVNLIKIKFKMQNVRVVATFKFDGRIVSTPILYFKPSMFCESFSSFTLNNL